MQEMDCVEVIAEKEKYAKDGVHQGMQGWICNSECIEGYWLVNFPQRGEKQDIATIAVKEKDLLLLSNGMDASVIERIKTQFENSARAANEFSNKPDDLSGYLI